LRNQGKNRATLVVSDEIDDDSFAEAAAAPPTSSPATPLLIQVEKQNEIIEN
jgi:hypothetical protein